MLVGCPAAALALPSCLDESMLAVLNLKLRGWVLGRDRGQANGDREARIQGMCARIGAVPLGVCDAIVCSLWLVSERYYPGLSYN